MELSLRIPPWWEDFRVNERIKLALVAGIAKHRHHRFFGEVGKAGVPARVAEAAGLQKSVVSRLKKARSADMLTEYSCIWAANQLRNQDQPPFDMADLRPSTLDVVAATATYLIETENGDAEWPLNHSCAYAAYMLAASPPLASESLRVHANLETSSCVLNEEGLAAASSAMTLGRRTVEEGILATAQALDPILQKIW